MDEEILECPLHQNFKFYSECPMHECLYYTTKCEVGCIILGTKVPDNATYSTISKQLSISEILFYKGDLIPKASLRFLQSLKKEGMIRLKTLVGLYYYTDWIQHTFYEEIKFIDAVIAESPCSLVTEKLEHYPFNIKLLNITAGLLLVSCLPNNFKRYQAVSKVPIEADLLSMLELTEETQRQLNKLYKKLLKEKTNGC